MFRKIMMFILPVMVLLIALASAYALVVTKPIPEQIETPESTTAIRVLTVLPSQSPHPPRPARAADAEDGIPPEKGSAFLVFLG